MDIATGAAFARDWGGIGGSNVVIMNDILE